MLTVSMATLLVAATVAPLAKSPDWQTDYGKAYSIAAAKQKPLVVFIAPGKTGPQKVVAEGTIAPESNRLLGEQYICVFVDSDTDAGKKLAQTFEMKEGIVISNRSGDKQVLRHDGTVQGADLTRYLTDVIEPTAVLTSTAQGTTAIPASIPRRTPVRNVLGAVRDTFIPPPFDPNCRT